MKIEHGYELAPGVGAYYEKQAEKCLSIPRKVRKIRLA
jgi:hypothetical protein